MNNFKKIELFQSKLDNNPSELEKIVYSEGLSLLSNNVNPDKVQHWVSTVLNTFDIKPKPESEKEKRIKLEKLAKRQAMLEKFNDINDKMKILLNEYGISIISFFDYKSISEFEYQTLQERVKNKGYNFIDVGNGAVEIFVSEKIIDKIFIDNFNKLKNELYDSSKDNIVDEYMVNDIMVFKNKLDNLKTILPLQINE